MIWQEQKNGRANTEYGRWFTDNLEVNWVTSLLIVNEYEKFS